MNQYKRNIVIVGLNEREKEKLFFEDIRKQILFMTPPDELSRFPYIVYEDTLVEGLKHQGFLMILKINEKITNYIEYDIKNRHKFKKFTYVYLYDDDLINCYSFLNENPFKKLQLISGRELFYSLNYIFLKRKYKQYIENEKLKEKMTQKRKNNIERLNNYLKEKKFATTKQIANDLGVSTKWVDRYTLDLAIVHQNIGFDDINKQWYITK